METQLYIEYIYRSVFWICLVVGELGLTVSVWYWYLTEKTPCDVNPVKEFYQFLWVWFLCGVIVLGVCSAWPLLVLIGVLWLFALGPVSLKKAFMKKKAFEAQALLECQQKIPANLQFSEPQKPEFFDEIRRP